VSCREAEADKRDWQELLGQHSSSSHHHHHHHAASEDNSTSVPSTDAQLLRAKLIRTAQKLVHASRAAKAHSSKQRLQIASSSSSETAAAVEEEEITEQQAQQQHEQWEQQRQAAEAAEAVSGDEEEERPPTVGQLAVMQFEDLMLAAGRDSYGTTQQSPAEIAQQIADSNRRAAGGGDGSDGEGGWLLQTGVTAVILWYLHSTSAYQLAGTACGAFIEFLHLRML
jgi:hypothetical protein